MSNQLNLHSIVQYRSNWLVYLYVLFLPFSWINVVFGSLYRLFMIFSFLLFFLLRKKNESGNSINKTFLLLWSVFWGYEVLSSFWAKNFSLEAQNNPMSIFLLYTFVLICSYHSPFFESSISTCWLYAGIISILSFFYGFTVFGLQDRLSISLFGTVTDPNEYAGLFSITTPFLLNYFFVSKKIIVKLFLFLTFIVESYIILATGSRGALLATLVCIFVFFLFSLKLKFSFILISILFFLSFLLLFDDLLLLIPETVLNRLTVDSFMDDAGSNRNYIWREAYQSFSEDNLFYIIFGTGSDGVSALYTTTMHNNFLQILFNYGVVGFCLYLFLLFKIFLRIIREHMSVCYLAAFFGILVMSSTITMSVVYKPFWIFLISLSFVDLHNGKSPKMESHDHSTGDLLTDL